jgi:hypothetical protein
MWAVAGALICVDHGLASPPVLPGPDVFPIGCFPGPTSDANTLENWRAVKDANFTVVCPVYRYDEQANRTMLEHCETLGLKATINVKIVPPTAETPLPADWKRQVKSTVATYGHYKALFGYMLKDEPRADQFDQLRDVTAEFLAQDPSHCTCINLFPIYASTEQLGTPTYQDHLNRYLRIVRPAFLCYDHYTFLKDGRDRHDFFENLEIAREASQEVETPCWIVILAGWREHFRIPTEGEMRWQVYSSLAYGMKGIFYFTYWPVSDDYVAIVDHNGRPGPLYAIVKQLNSEILQLGKTLLHLRSTAVYHTGGTIPQGCSRLPVDSLLNVPQELPLMVGFFNGPDDSRYAMVVNRDNQRPVATQVHISEQIRSIWRMPTSRDNSRPVRVDVEGAAIDLAPGGGVLLRLDRGA